MRGVVLVVDLLLPVSAHVALDRCYGAINVGDCLALCRLSNEHFTVFRECDD